MKNNPSEKTDNKLSVLIGTAIGLVAGYLYYRFVGCADGSCAIAASPVLSTLYGGFLGGMIPFLLGSGCCCACSGGSCRTGNDASE